jgi:hypothetical protein
VKSWEIIEMFADVRLLLSISRGAKAHGLRIYSFLRSTPGFCLFCRFPALEIFALILVIKDLVKVYAEKVKCAKINIKTTP